MQRLSWLTLSLLLGVLTEVSARPSLTLEQMRRAASAPKLEKAVSYLSSAEAARRVFAAQSGLVTLPPECRTIILPDLHAQRDYLLKALELPFEGGTVFDGLQAGKVNLLCLGDGMHSEGRGQSRWEQAEADYLQGVASPALEAEMRESLGLLKMVMDLKVAFPQHFYFVRGNHEDIDPSVPYMKFTRVGESELVRHWVLQRFGPEFLRAWHACEQSMPLLAQGGSFVASHAAPGAALDLDKVKARSPLAFRICAWTDNTRWNAGGSEEKAFEANCRALQVSVRRPWVVGHRKVVGSLYRSQCGGKLIQINPLDSDPRVILMAPPRGQALRPARDVRKL